MVTNGDTYFARLCLASCAPRWLASPLTSCAVLKGFAAAKPRKELVEGLLNQVNLWDVRHKALTGFSGGNEPKTSIIRCEALADPVTACKYVSLE